ncbi:PREDICTED: uncharacterized protein LOC109583759 isoform X1 [Amphimedon queenslandica]|uniref:Immunoglobulin subtype domain-containing protein n=1 Tax=Amphimedon queenslandica TaxID=400682 RepID=A0AAN0JDH0_AMPQE|nr:PREDICTED: uncharacterized protein LOC109583759 isoform X1 [Amphimedon queenslandica]|eukprot:XP_019854763.1 PREDICTED: uncharacterized protein LOC109583759 isoform X1 [Amphimedon queenslandica]
MAHHYNLSQKRTALLTFSHLILTVLLLECQAIDRDCQFEGLPENVKSSDNVHTLTVPSSESLLTLNLTCNCSVYNPQWHIRLIGKVSPGERANSFYQQGIECINNTRPCSRDIDYINPINKSRGLYVYSRQNLTLTRSTAIMCYSNIIREVLIVSFTNDRTDQSGLMSSLSITTSTPSTASEDIQTSTVSPTSAYTAPTEETNSANGEHATSMQQAETITKRITTSIVSIVTSTVKTGGCSVDIKPETITVRVTPTLSTGDAGIADSIVKSVGGSTSLLLIVLVLMLITLSIGLCGMIICMKTRNKQQPVYRDYDCQRRQSNCSIKYDQEPSIVSPWRNSTSSLPTNNRSSSYIDNNDNDRNPRYVTLTVSEV